MSDVTLSLDPAWPWSLPALGLPLLAGLALALAALTIWTYLGLRGATVRRVSLIVLLRLLALAVALLVVARPALDVRHVEGLEPSRLLVLFDSSASMSVADDFNGLSRWANAGRIWSSKQVQRALERLAQEQQIEVVKYQGAADLQSYDPSGPADGKRTDFGTWLHELWQRHGQDAHLRGLVIFSDGADNGKRYSPLELARQKWRGKCPIYAFGHGNPDDSRDRKDIALTAIQVSPAPVPIKTKLTVKATVQAPGFAGAAVRVGLWLEDSADGAAKLMGEVQERQLTSVKDNEIVMSCDAPDRPDEYKVTLKIEPLPDEASKTNNEISTYVQVTKEGVSVLWVEGKPRYESKFPIEFALKTDRRFRVDYTEPPPLGHVPAGKTDWYQFDKRHYDVIVIADVSAARFSLGNPDVLRQVHELVRDKATGLLMLGGYDTFASGGWDKTPLVDLLPVTMDRQGQFEGPTRVRPTAEGLNYPFMKLRAEPEQNRALWEKLFEPLDGMTYLGKPTRGATVLAQGNDEPILVASRSGGRVLAFGGDTTYKAWRRTPEAVVEFDRFWKQLILWLARQDTGGGNLWVDLDRRRLLADGRDTLGFTFGLRGKTGVDLPAAEFGVKIVGPHQEQCKLTTAKEGSVHRGTIGSAPAAGEYRLIVTGHGKDVDGSEVKDEKVARFLVAVEDIEGAYTAADHEFLIRLANEAGGHFAPADEQRLLQFLEELKGQARAESRLRVEHWPDWRRHPASESWGDQLTALWKSSALACFLLFTGLLCAEWGLRRWWGWV
jgi:uncharacterized membrane protein